MSEIARRPSGEVTPFDPGQMFSKLANLEGDVVRFRKLKDWPELEKAVDAIMAEQAAFVANWDVTVGIFHGAGRGKKNVLGHSFSVTEAEAKWGFSQPTVSRWRTSLKTPDKYRERLIIGSHRVALLEAAENHRAEGTGENEWFTPPQYIEAARAVMGAIDLDPATHPAAQETIRAKRFYTREDDGLTQQWRGRVWLNPPYAQPAIARFVEKLVEEFAAGRVSQAIMLTHNYTDTAWFHLAAASASVICFTRGRIRFVDLDGEECAPTQGQAFFYYGTNGEEFVTTFADFGLVLCRA